MSADKVEHLHSVLKEQFGGNKPWLFQVELIQAQEEHRDALCQAAMGMGKMAIAAGPYTLSKNLGWVTIMVSPLIRLQDEMVITMFQFPF